MWQFRLSSSSILYLAPRQFIGGLILQLRAYSCHFAYGRHHRYQKTTRKGRAVQIRKPKSGSFDYFTCRWFRPIELISILYADAKWWRNGDERWPMPKPKFNFRIFNIGLMIGHRSLNIFFHWFRWTVMDRNILFDSTQFNNENYYHFRIEDEMVFLVCSEVRVDWATNELGWLSYTDGINGWIYCRLSHCARGFCSAILLNWLVHLVFHYWFGSNTFVALPYIFVTLALSWIAQVIDNKQNDGRQDVWMSIDATFIFPIFRRQKWW